MGARKGGITLSQEPLLSILLISSTQSSSLWPCLLRFHLVLPSCGNLSSAELLLQPAKCMLAGIPVSGPQGTLWQMKSPAEPQSSWVRRLPGRICNCWWNQRIIIATDKHICRRQPPPLQQHYSHPFPFQKKSEPQYDAGRILTIRKLEASAFKSRAFFTALKEVKREGS